MDDAHQPGHQLGHESLHWRLGVPQGKDCAKEKRLKKADWCGIQSEKKPVGRPRVNKGARDRGGRTAYGILAERHKAGVRKYSRQKKSKHVATDF